MKNHAGIMDAVLDIQSEEDRGTSIMVTVPDPYI